MKYIVKVNYTRFSFNNGAEALAFAETAAENVTEKTEVEIELKKEDAENE